MYVSIVCFVVNGISEFVYVRCLLYVITFTCLFSFLKYIEQEYKPD